MRAGATTHRKENPMPPSIIEEEFGKLEGVTAIYGEWATGKTVICMLAALEAAKSGKKVFYIDSQKNFSVERLAQLDPSYAKILGNLVVIRPHDFSNQEKLLEGLRKKVEGGTGLVVVDTISALYRLKFAKKEKDSYLISRGLGLQLTYLNDMARKHGIPVIVTSEAQGKPESGQESAMAAGGLIDYMCANVIELKRYEGARKIAILKKSPEKKRKRFMFEIVQEGIRVIA